MAYVRLSIATARTGQAARLEEIMRKLNEFSMSQPGCTASYLMKPSDDSHEIARLSIYENEAAAEHVANSAHVMALRSEVNLVAEPGHLERAFKTY